MKSVLPIFLVAFSFPAFAEGAGFGDPGKSLWIAHGVLMYLAWGVVFPLGALIAVYRRHVGETGKVFLKSPSFYPPHFYFQCLGIVMNIAAMILAVRANFLVYETGNPFAEVNLNSITNFFPSNRHVKMGLATIALLVRCEGFFVWNFVNSTLSSPCFFVCNVKRQIDCTIKYGVCASSDQTSAK